MLDKPNMATAHHLSMVTNSCVKPPINPKSGLSFTVEERSLADRSATWHGRDADFLDERGDLSQFLASRSVNFDTTNMTNTMMDTVVQDVNDLSDADFYQRLVDLKTEHKKTLELCEQLYNEKIREQRLGEIDRQNGGRPLPVASVDADYTMSSRPLNPHPYAIGKSPPRKSVSTSRGMDKVRDMSSTKPPSGQPKLCKGRPSKFVDSKSRQVQAERKSIEDRQLYGLSDSESDINWDVVKRPRSSKQFREKEGDYISRSALMKSKIDDMWENFSVEDYTPKTSMRQRSNSFSGMPTPSEQKKSEWKHRLTIPKPFKMTIRDEGKTPRKSQVLEEEARKKEEQMRMEEEECQKIFKAKPVPAHVYMPLFDEIMEEKESRKRFIRENSKEFLQSLQKPFKFSTREEEKKKYQRSQNAALAELQDNYEIRKSKEFKANPFPEHIFDDGGLDKLKEEEEYRRIRKQMRAEDLLRSSSLPPNMKARGKDYFSGRSRQKAQAERAKKAGIAIENKFKPKVNEGVPDFDELHHKFMKGMSKKKYSKEATVCKPFNFRSESSSSMKDDIYDDILEDEKKLRENRWPFVNSRSKPFRKESGWVFGGSLSTSMDSIPAKMTAAAALRKSATKGKMQQQIDKELAELESERRRRIRERELKKSITKKAMANDQTKDLRLSTQEKLKEHRIAERTRMEEYKKELKTMYEKVQSRPLLFEQTIQKNAQQRAGRKYNETLKQAGLDENFIRSKGKKYHEHEDDSLQDSDDMDSYSHPVDSHRSYASHYSNGQSSHRSAHSASNSASRHYTDDFEAGDDKGNRTEDDEGSIKEDFHNEQDELEDEYS